MRYRWAVLLLIVLLLLGVVGAILVVFLPKTEGAEGWRVSQAFVAGGFIASGWLAAFALREISDMMERQQRRSDIVRALASEIRDYHEQFSQVDPETQARDMWDQIQGDHTYAKEFFHPLVPLISMPVVFEALVADIHYLPERKIGAVTRFYSKLSTLRLFAEELRDPLARQLSADRRRKLYWGYMQNLKHTTEAGVRALRVLGAKTYGTGAGAPLNTPPGSDPELPQTSRGRSNDQS